jgi:heat shock protein HslJ
MSDSMPPVIRRAPRPTRGAGLVCLLLLAFVLAGCTAHSRAAESEALLPQDPGDLQGTEWTLVATGDFDAVPASTPLSLHIADRTASGSGPCNRYRMKFTNSGEDVTTGTLASTKVACEPRRMRAEQRFFRDLEAVDTALLEDDQLVLTGPDDVRLVFEPAGDD